MTYLYKVLTLRILPVLAFCGISVRRCIRTNQGAYTVDLLGSVDPSTGSIGLPVIQLSTATSGVVVGLTSIVLEP
jgi:hypothetical protein